MKTILQSKTVPSGDGGVDLSVVLSEHREGRYCTHIEDMERGGRFWGHYDLLWSEACQDFDSRFRRLCGHS